MIKPTIKTFDYGGGTVEIYDESDDPDDCLHCLLWSAIGKYCREHPDSVCVEDLLGSLADVIGDQLVSPGSAPLQDEFIETINRRIKQRIAIKTRDRR